MPKKSKYDLKDAKAIKVPLVIWNAYVKEFGIDNAAEKIRDDLDLCINIDR